jgi:hypothetical protein
MKNNQLLKILLGGSIFLSALSCDNDNEATPKPEPDGEALAENFIANVENLRQEFTITAGGGNVTGEQGTALTFYGGFLTQQGEPVTGDVDIELIEIFDKGSMVLTKKATNGKTEDGAIGTLISGGEFFVNATQGGQPLKIDGGFSIMVPTDNTGELSNDMFLFAGKEACDGDKCELVWEQQADKRVEAGQGQGTGGEMGSYYYAFQNQFGWTNIDRWYSDPRPKTTIFVDVPEGYDDSNSVVFLSYDGEPTALARMDVYDGDTKLFTEHYGLIPIGLEVHFIFVSMVDDEWTYAIQGATITENHVEEITDVQTITEEQLKALINALP